MNQQQATEINENVSFLINCKDDTHVHVQPKADKENFMMFVRIFFFSQ